MDAEQWRALDAVHRRGDRVVAGLLALHFVAGLGFAAFYETWFETWTVGGLALGMFLLAAWLLPGHAATRSVAGISLQAFVALHIYQLHGLAEMHFFFFTAFAALLVYQDWACMWPGALLIIAQHIWFAVLHNQGAQVWFFEDGYIGATKLGFHFGIALFHVVLCNAAAVLLRRQTLAAAAAKAEADHARRTAESASRAKTEFLGNMSHELRTPLVGVRGMAELLLQRDQPEAVRQDLETILHSADAVVALVNDALDLARVEAGRMELAAAPFDLRQLAEEVCELLAPRAAAQGVELVLHWAPGGPQQLVGDSGRWRQVLVNLVGNAVKFAGGQPVLVEIEVGPPAADGAAAVLVRVDDAGIGIAPEQLPLLFGRFEQGGASTYGRFGGSGLGLAISRQLVELMGGALHVHSVPGHGALFVVAARLPVAAAAAPEPLPAPLRVLVAGPRRLEAAALAAQLGALGADVHTATSAAAVAAALAAGGFQLAFAAAEFAAAGWPAGLRRIPFGAGAAGPATLRFPHRHRELRHLLGLGVAAARPSRPLPQLGLRVLLAEDDPVCATVASRLLARLGCRVEVAGDGPSAIAAAAAQPFDLVLMDYRMPGCDGPAAARAIRAAAGAARGVPIVGLSANSLPEDRAAFLAAGAAEFLAKPVGLEPLAAALQRAVAGARPPAG